MPTLARLIALAHKSPIVRAGSIFADRIDRAGPATGINPVFCIDMQRRVVSIQTGKYISEYVSVISEMVLAFVQEPERVDGHIIPEEILAADGIVLFDIIITVGQSLVVQEPVKTSQFVAKFAWLKKVD